MVDSHSKPYEFCRQMPIIVNKTIREEHESLIPTPQGAQSPLNSFLEDSEHTIPFILKTHTSRGSCVLCAHFTNCFWKTFPEQ